MKAATFQSPGAIVLTDISPPVLQEEEVLLEIRYIGLCGTDLSTYRGQMPLVSFPRIPGHEIGAVVIAKGAKVPAEIRMGQYATVFPYTHCGHCPACMAGRFNTCQFNQTLGVQRDGALREQFSVHYSKLYPGTTLSLQELALVEPLSVGYHAANRGQVKAADTVLVLGCGVIGIGAVLAAVQKGAAVIAADIDEHKLQFIRQFGVVHTVNTNHAAWQANVLTYTEGRGADVVIEAAGAPATYRAALQAVSFAGRVVCIGYAKQAISLDTTLIVKKELTLCGSRNAMDEFVPVMQMLAAKRYPFAALITRVYPLPAVAQAFADWNAHPEGVVKLLIDVQAAG